jgi:D-alanyl-D-alanine carboxypeptidase (penicillin-binding protein 5/6)
MNSSELQQLAKNSRFMRQTGIGLLLTSLVLAVFLFIPLTPAKERTVAAITDSAPPAAPDAFADTHLEAKAAIVYDLVTGETLYEQNADAQLPLASLTKLLTVYAALSALSPDTLVTIPKEATKLDLPRAFNEGQTFPLKDLARLTLTASLNDGAAAILEAAAAQQNRSASQELASVAAALDLSQTYAVNGSGLDMSAAVSGGYGSARDLARLAGALVEKAPDIARATTQLFAEAISLGGTAFKVKNTDPIVGSIPRLLLSKTGFTDLAGGNLALVFDSAIAHPIAVIILGSTEKARFTDAAKLVYNTLAHFAGVASL